MRLSLVVTTFPCASETFAAREIEMLGRLGFEITIFAARGKENRGYIPRGAKVVYRPGLLSARAVMSCLHFFCGRPLAVVKLGRLVLSLSVRCVREALSLIANFHTVAFFAGILERERISHIHAYFLNWPACVAMALSVVSGRTFSISAHARDVFVEHGAACLKVSQAEFVRTCTREALRKLETMVPARSHGKLKLVYHGMRMACGGFGSCEAFSAGAEGRDVVMAVGRLVRKKGFSNLVRAFAWVVQRGGGRRLVIVGDGPARSELEELIKRLRLGCAAEILGWQERDVTLRLFQRAAVLVVPSIVDGDGDRDGIPNVVLEAFACGVPVVASRLEGISEAVIQRQTGLLVEPGDVSSLSLAIEGLLGDRDLQHRLSHNAYEAAVRSFDLTKNVRELAKLCKRAAR